MSAQELEDLLIEFHDCARYDELDGVKRYLEDPRIDVNGADFNGATALHKAAANGNLEVVEYLISQGARYTKNLSGHTPLSWAVLTKQLDMVRLLLRVFDDDIDVVVVPGQGVKSILTLAFDTGVSEIVDLVLGHKSGQSLEQQEPSEVDAADAGDSASAEGPEGPEDEEPSDSPVPKSTNPRAAGQTIGFVEHLLSFSVKAAPACPPEAQQQQEQEQQQQEPSSEPTPIRLSIRELPAVGNLEALAANQADQTGLALWASALVLGRWLADRPEFLRGKRVLELGSGTGLTGALAAAVGGSSCRVLLSDQSPHVLKNLEYNLDLNQDALVEAGAERVSVRRIDWTDRQTWPRNLDNPEEFEQFDVVLLSDCCYRSELLPALADTVGALLAPAGGQLYTVAPLERDGGNALAEELRRVGLQTVSVGHAPKKLRSNCSLAQDDESFFAFFPELQECEFRLQRLLRVKAGPVAPAAKKKKKRVVKKPSSPAPEKELSENI